MEKKSSTTLTTLEYDKIWDILDSMTLKIEEIEAAYSTPPSGMGGQDSDRQTLSASADVATIGNDDAVGTGSATTAANASVEASKQDGEPAEKRPDEKAAEATWVDSNCSTGHLFLDKLPSPAQSIEWRKARFMDHLRVWIPAALLVLLVSGCFIGGMLLFHFPLRPADSDDDKTATEPLSKVPESIRGKSLELPAEVVVAGRTINESSLFDASRRTEVKTSVRTIPPIARQERRPKAPDGETIVQASGIAKLILVDPRGDSIKVNKFAEVYRGSRFTRELMAELIGIPIDTETPSAPHLHGYQEDLEVPTFKRHTSVANDTGYSDEVQFWVSKPTIGGVPTRRSVIPIKKIHSGIVVHCIEDSCDYIVGFDGAWLGAPCVP